MAQDSAVMLTNSVKAAKKANNRKATQNRVAFCIYKPLLLKATSG